MSSGFGYPTGYLHETLRGLGLVYVVHATNQPGRSVQLPGMSITWAMMHSPPAPAGSYERSMPK